MENLKIKILKQQDGYYLLKVKGIGQTFADSLEDIGIAIDELIKINNEYAAEEK